MMRLQVQLTDVQVERLRGLAASGRVSLSELVRQGIDRLVACPLEPSAEERRRRALAAAGRHRSGRRDVSARHDAHLAEAYAP
jgi:Arc/MetJ-type ribon-helix-helix transcriptional regulator